MKNKDIVLESMGEVGRQKAEALQKDAADMSGTELNGSRDYIPTFEAALRKKNMQGREVGFVCVSPSGRVVRLLQRYNSNVYTGVPEELPSLWGFVWSQNPEDALPFVAISTSPYMVGDCCTEDGKTYRSTTDNNVWSPSEASAYWTEVTE